MRAKTASRSKIHDAAIRLFAERGAEAIVLSDLAEAAGVARGTIYNNLENPDDLYGEVATDLAHEMHERITASMAGIPDPAARIATGLRLFVRRAHEEPHWGRFMVRFALSDDILRKSLDEPPAADIARSVKQKRFDVEPARAKAMLSLLVGGALSAMHAVLSGHQTWRDAGSDAAELFLRAAGVAPAEARKIALSDLTPLANPRNAARASRRKREKR